MKLIDKFLKKLNTDRNTFATYLLTLITIYLSVDRIVEILLMAFTGVSYAYWGPIQYTLALACPIFAFLFSGQSQFATSNNKKVTMFYLNVIALTILTVSMFTQWLNMGVWLFLVSTPGYVDLITNFSELFRPALTALTLFFPLVIVPAIFNFVFFGVNDNLAQIRSIWDYRGISLANNKAKHGPYTFETFFGIDKDTGKTIIIPEESRFQAMLVCGGSGSGKTSLVYEPLIARDLERKFFLREVAKEMGYTALKTNIAVLNKPYDNEYLNQNFHISMLSPVSGKEEVYKAYLKKLIISSSPEFIYKDSGITVLSPDREISDHMISVCKNFQLPYQVVDPSDPKSVGINPFVYHDPTKIAITISSALKSMYQNAHEEVEDAFREDVTIQAIENLAILLKEMYPRLNDGKLPNLEDMLKMLTNFELVEKMCEIMAHDDELNEKYAIQIAYFKKHFYSSGSAKQETEKNVYAAVAQLDNLLRLPGVKSILCNRNQNINFDEMLANGMITFVCTRRGDLGAASHKAFGLFFIVAMQNAVLRRPGNENSRIPNFFYIDEFADYLGKSTEALFTMYRKYRVSVSISVQNLSQLDTPMSKEKYRNTILANCGNKVFTGNAPFDELEWWKGELSTHREWTMKDTIDFDKMKYESKHSDVSWKYVDNFAIGKLQYLGIRDCAYKLKGEGGRPMIGPAKLNFLDSKYKEPQKVKTFDFSKYSNRVTTGSEDHSISDKKKKFNPKKLDFTDERNEFDPVQTDDTDTKFLFDNDNAIVINLKKGKPNE